MDVDSSEWKGVVLHRSDTIDSRGTKPSKIKFDGDQQQAERNSTERIDAPSRIAQLGSRRE
jgi:hypothetical protein